MSLGLPGERQADRPTQRILVALDGTPTPTPELRDEAGLDRSQQVTYRLEEYLIPAGLATEVERDRPHHNSPREWKLTLDGRRWTEKHEEELKSIKTLSEACDLAEEAIEVARQAQASAGTATADVDELEGDLDELESRLDELAEKRGEETEDDVDERLDELETRIGELDDETGEQVGYTHEQQGAQLVRGGHGHGQDAYSSIDQWVAELENRLESQVGKTDGLELGVEHNKDRVDKHKKSIEKAEKTLEKLEERVGELEKLEERIEQLEDRTPDSPFREPNS